MLKHVLKWRSARRAEVTRQLLNVEGRVDLIIALVFTPLFDLEVWNAMRRIPAQYLWNYSMAFIRAQSSWIKQKRLLCEEVFFWWINNSPYVEFTIKKIVNSEHGVCKSACEPDLGLCVMSSRWIASRPYIQHLQNLEKAQLLLPCKHLRTDIKPPKQTVSLCHPNTGLHSIHNMRPPVCTVQLIASGATVDLCVVEMRQ